MVCSERPGQDGGCEAASSVLSEPPDQPPSQLGGGGGSAPPTQRQVHRASHSLLPESYLASRSPTSAQTTQPQLLRLAWRSVPAHLLILASWALGSTRPAFLVSQDQLPEVLCLWRCRPKATLPDPQPSRVRLSPCGPSCVSAQWLRAPISYMHVF